MLMPVRWDLGHREMATQFCCGYATAAILPVLCYVFVHKFLFKPHFHLKPDYIIRKPIRHRIQWCNLRRKILSTFHTWVDHRSVRHFPTEKNRVKMPKNARNHAINSPFPLMCVDFHLTHKCLAHPTHHAKRQPNRYTHFHTTTQQSPPKLPLPLRRSPPKSNTPIPSPTPLTTPNGIRIQSAVLPQFTRADRQMAGQMFSNISALLAILIESDALIILN